MQTLERNEHLHRKERKFWLLGMLNEDEINNLTEMHEVSYLPFFRFLSTD